MVVPPLPPSWPYARRSPLPPLHVRDGVSIPGQLGVWTLLGPPGLELEGSPEALPGAFGRGGVHRLGDAVVRPYCRGGLLGRLVRRRYLSSGRFQTELQVHRALWEAGFPTVEPLGCAWRRCLPYGFEGLFLTRAMDARSWASDWAGGAEVVRVLWAHMSALASWGLWCPDLNATNVLRTPDGSLTILDWDRARWDSREDLACRYRKRLLRSLHKRLAPSDMITLLEGL